MTRVRRRRWPCCLAGAVLVCLTLAGSASAQVIADTERFLLAERAGALRNLDGLSDAFWKGLSDLRREEDRQRALKADISFGLTGDEAGSRSLFKLNTGITLSRGVFPSEVTVISKLGLQQRDGQLQEDVTSFLISYDYHASHHVQYFTFAERFSDSFLSVQQRYEIGFGARIGRHFGRVGTWERTARSLAAVRAGLPRIAAARAAMPAGTLADVPDLQTDEAGSVPRALDRLEHALGDRSARLFVGLVASAFAELERAEIEAVLGPGPGATQPAITAKVPIDATHRYRLSLRPSVVFRPLDEVEIFVHPYFKLPLDGSRRVTMPGGARRLDYRRDVLSAMEWTIKEDDTGLEAVSFLLTVNHYFDNVPPVLPAQFVADVTASGRAIDRVEAERSHRMMSMALKLKW